MERIFACRSISREVHLFYWMVSACVVLQKGKMRPRALFRMFLRIIHAGIILLAGAGNAAIAQSITAAPNHSAGQQVTKSEAGKQEEAARAAARAKAHHFDRVVIIVLENTDYERAMQDPNLTALASQGASFTNFHALFHPSYPNYLAMIAGTDFELHRRG